MIHLFALIPREALELLHRNARSKCSSSRSRHLEAFEDSDTPRAGESGSDGEAHLNREEEEAEVPPPPPPNIPLSPLPGPSSTGLNPPATHVGQAWISRPGIPPHRKFVSHW